MAELHSTPDWVKDAIFYQIFPDRFAASTQVEKPHNLEPWDALPTPYGFKGGDLLGISERLDYLQDLGITALYLNPIFQSASNHRYHTHDYYQVDPILGGDPAFRALLENAHQRNIRVVLDGVFNHASRGFFQFNHLLENGASSPYLDWFSVNDFPLNAYAGSPNYDCWVGLPALPKLNTNNPQVRSFIFDVARYWLERGIDGWRLDVPYEIKDPDFWREFRRVVKTANPEAYIVGEIAWEAQPWLQGDQFDAVMNYQFMQACLGFFAGDRIVREIEANMMGLPPTPVLDAPAFLDRAAQLLTIYPRDAAYAQLNLLDSHDMPRFVALCGGDQASLVLAVLFQMTYPGAPCIYYGTEIGLEGGRRNYPEDSRRSFPWDSSRWDYRLRSFYRQAIALRKSAPALRWGDFSPFYANGQAIGFLRAYQGETFAIVIQNGQYPVDIPLPTAGPWEVVFDTSRDGAVQEPGRDLENVRVPARAGLVLRSQASSQVCAD